MTVQPAPPWRSRRRPQRSGPRGEKTAQHRKGDLPAGTGWGNGKKAAEKGGRLMENRFIRAEDVAAELGVSKPYAYKLIRQLNEELRKKGFLTIAGRVNRQYFEERFYGAENRSANEALPPNERPRNGSRNFTSRPAAIWI